MFNVTWLVWIHSLVDTLENSVLLHCNFWPNVLGVPWGNTFSHNGMHASIISNSLSKQVWHIDKCALHWPNCRVSLEEKTAMGIVLHESWLYWVERATSVFESEEEFYHGDPTVSAFLSSFCCCRMPSKLRLHHAWKKNLITALNETFVAISMMFGYFKEFYGFLDGDFWKSYWFGDLLIFLVFCTNF